MQNYIKNLNYQTFYQKNNEKSIFLSLFDSNQSKNDIILYRRENGKYVLHRIVKIKGNDLLLCGDNQSDIEKGITVDMVIAKVKGIYLEDTYYEGDKANKKLYYFRLFLKRKIKPFFRKTKSVIKNPSKLWRKIKGEKR